MAKGDSGYAKTANGASGNGNNGDQDGMIPPIVLASGSFNPTSLIPLECNKIRSILLLMEDNNNTTDKERKAIRTLPPGTYS